VGPIVVALAPSQGAIVHTHVVPDHAAAEAGLADGSLDAVLIAGDRLRAKSDAPGELDGTVQLAVAAARIRSVLVTNGVPDDQVSSLLAPPRIAVSTIEPRDPNRQTNATVAFVAVLLLYGQLFGYGVWVATGVIEEKASRVVEILLSTIRARELLAGKVAGIGALGLLQLTCIAGYAIVLASVTGLLHLPLQAAGTALLVIGWFVLGFAFYATLFAVAGSLVSRMEELQNAIVPLNLVILASFFISLGSTKDPSSTLSIVASLVPFSSSLAMPVRIALGAATAPQIVASLVILIGSTLLLIPLAGRLYAGAVLRVGSRVKLRDAWRASA
jgi:ABC-2 type transport system permease protein